MKQDETFKQLAREISAKADAAGSPAVQACYRRVAEAYLQVAAAYEIKPERQPRPAPPAFQARMCVTPAEVLSTSLTLLAMAKDRQARLLATMHAAAQLHRRHRDLEFESEKALLLRRR